MNKPGLVVKPQDGWSPPSIPAHRSSPPIFSAPSPAPPAVLIYSDANDVIYAGGDYLALYAPAGGSRTVKLPHLSRVTDLLQHTITTQDATEFPLTLPPNGSALFKIEP